MKTLAALCLSLLAAPVLASGTLDKTFADNGVLVMRFDEANAEVADIRDFAVDGVVDHQGRYVSVGHAIDEQYDYEYFGQITRHLPSGERDLSLAGQGFLRFRYSPLWATQFKAVAEHNGKLIVSGYAETGDELMNPKRSALVCRFNEAGEPDPSFAADFESDRPGCGSYGEIFSWSNSSVIDMQIAEDGKILLLVDTEAAGSSSYALVRLTADGEPDQTFGDDNCVESKCGYVLSPMSLSTLVTPVAFSVDEAHGIAVAVHFSLSGNSDMAVINHKINGGIENGFSVDGMAAVGFDDIFKAQTGETGGTDDVPAGVGFLNDGSILVAGTATPKGLASENSNRYSRVGVAKFQPDGELDESFGNNTSNWSTAGRFLDMYSYSTGSYASSFKIQSNGKIILAGRCTDCKGVAYRERFVVTRILADGSSLDKSWGVPSDITDNSTIVDVGGADSYSDAFGGFNGASAVVIDKGRIVVFGWNKMDADPFKDIVGRSDPHIVRLELDNMFSDGFDF